MQKRKVGECIFDITNLSFMVVIMLITVYPLVYVLFASVSDPMKISDFKGILLAPKGFSLVPYKLVFQNPNILSGYKNTLIYVVLGTFINLLMTTLGAYVLSRKTFFFRNILMFIIAFTMYFSGGLIPYYLVVRNLGMINTIWSMVIPTAISAWNLIIMRSSFMEIPESMEESAKMDGANDLIILFRIIVPLSLPMLAVMTLFYGVGNWNAWFNAVIFLRDRSLYPIQVFLREILLFNINDSMLVTSSDLEGLKAKFVVQYAVIVVSTIPILMMYPFLQRYFVKGVMIGAIKG